MNQTMKYKKLYPDAKTPQRMTEYAAGYDIYSYDEGILKAGEHKLFKTGIAIQLPENYEGIIRGRSGLALKYGIISHIGTIDCITKDSVINISENKKVKLKDILEQPEKYNKVLSYNEELEEFEIKEISEVWSKGIKDIYKIELEDGSILKCTANHLFLTDKGWKKLSELNIEDDLIKTLK